MTSKERISLALQHKEADRVAISDGPWGTTIERWHKEGLPEDVWPAEYFGYEMASTGANLSMRMPADVIEGDRRVPHQRRRGRADAEELEARDLHAGVP